MNIWYILILAIFLILFGIFLKFNIKKSEKFFNEEVAPEEVSTEVSTEVSPVATEEVAPVATEEGTPPVTEEGTTPVTEEGTLVATEEGSEVTTEEGAEEGSEEGVEEGTLEGVEEGAEGAEQQKSKKRKSQAQKTAERVAKKVAIDAAKKLLFKMGSGPFGWISLIIAEVLKNVLNLDPKDFVDCPKGYYQADKLPKSIKTVISVVPGISDVFSLLGNKLCIKLGCSKDKFIQTGLCYKRCRAGYKNVGPVCWKTCGKDKDVGALCRERCRDGYKEIAGICYKNCGSGQKDLGLTCVKK